MLASPAGACRRGGSASCVLSVVCAPLSESGICSSYYRDFSLLECETERAAAERTEARRLVGDDRYSSIARLRAVESWGVPKVRALAEATYFAGLRNAGMPEE